MANTHWITCHPNKFTSRKIPANQPKTFKVTVHCNDSESQRIEKKIRTESTSQELLLLRATIQKIEQSQIVCITAFIECSTELRTLLVQLVHHLGFDPKVRSIRWEKID